MSQTNPWSKAGGEVNAANGSAPGAPPSPPASETPPAAATPVTPPAPKAPVKVKKPALVKMTRESPMFPGGPTTADVHEEELANWLTNDWKVVA